MNDNAQWILRERPHGAVGPQHLQLRRVARPEPRDGEVLVRNLYLLVPPAMRLWMNAEDSYVPAQPLGEPMMGITLGIVEASDHPALPVGRYVNGMGGCQQWFTAPAAQLMPLAPHPAIPLAVYRSVLDVQGLTAWAGLHQVCRPEPGQTLVVTAAAGSVGSIACQLGAQRGLHVVGIAGGADKCRWLREACGIAATIDYKADDVAARLDALCPRGIDMVFENVGGPVLDLLLERINDRARIALCGMVASYNGGGTQSARALMRLVTKAARLEGFLVRDHFDRYAEVVGQLQALMLEGRLTYRIDILDGLEQLPLALQRLFEGHNLGAQLLRLAPEDTR